MESMIARLQDLLEAPLGKGKRFSMITKALRELTKARIFATAPVLEEIPENSDIHLSGLVSRWGDHLAIIYQFKSSFNPEIMAEEWVIHYMVGDDGKPIKVTEASEWMVGKHIQDTISAEHSHMVKKPFGGYVMFDISPPKRVWMKKDVEHLGDRQMKKYIRYLSDIGYVDNTEPQASKKSWEILFESGFEALEEENPKDAYKIYDLLNFEFPDVSDEDIKKIRGVFTKYKKRPEPEIRWMLENEHFEELN